MACRTALASVAGSFEGCFEGCVEVRRCDDVVAAARNQMAAQRQFFPTPFLTYSEVQVARSRCGEITLSIPASRTRRVMILLRPDTVTGFLFQVIQSRSWPGAARTSR